VRYDEAKVTSKSSCQVSVAVIESDASINVSQPPTTFKSFVTDEYWEWTTTEAKLLTSWYMNCLQKSTKSSIIVWVS